MSLGRKETYGRLGWRLFEQDNGYKKTIGPVVCIEQKEEYIRINKFIADES